MEPSIAATLGEQHVGRYIGVVLYTNCSFGTWIPGRYTEVAVKRGSTVLAQHLSLLLLICMFEVNKLLGFGSRGIVRPG